MPKKLVKRPVTKKNVPKQKQKLDALLESRSKESHPTNVVQQELADQTVNITEVIETLKNVEIDKMEEILSSKISELTGKIETVEKQIKKLNEALGQHEEIDKYFKDDLAFIKTLIAHEQDKIMDLEERILALPETHYTADYPFIVRILLQMISGGDAITLSGKISASETRISQWDSRRLSIETYFSESLIETDRVKSELFSVNGVQENFRMIRQEMIRYRREFIKKINNNEILNMRDFILKNYSSSLQQLNEIGVNNFPNFTKFTNFKLGADTSDLVEIEAPDLKKKEKDR